MNNTKTLLSADEARSLMQKNIKPIMIRKKKSNKVLVDGVVHSTYWGSAILVMLLIIVNFAQAMEAHPIIGDGLAQPAMSYKKETTAPASGGTVRTSGLKYYNPVAEGIQKSLGDNVIKTRDGSLIRYELPGAYSKSINLSLFQTLSYYNTNVVNTSLPGWNANNNKNLNVDENGFIRYTPNKDKLTINNQADYVIASESFYKNTNIQGTRYLVSTTEGMYTIITDDEIDQYAQAPRFGGLVGADAIEQVYNFLRKKGCSHEAAIGILANIHQESGGDSGKHQVGGPAKGLLQWEGGRLNRLIDFAYQQGREWNDLECQLEFLWVELNSTDINERMKGTHSGFGSNLAKHNITGHPQGFEGFKATTDAEYATALFEGSFERAGIPMMENRYGAIAGLDQRFREKGKTNKVTGLLESIANEESGKPSNSTLRPGAYRPDSITALQGKILYIYRIE